MSTSLHQNYLSLKANGKATQKYNKNMLESIQTSSEDPEPQCY
jgi:hypothetical protein